MIKIPQLIASLFPGGYRFLAVNAVAVFSTTDVSASFVHAFFIISIICTLSGTAVSTQSYVTYEKNSLIGRLFLVLKLTIFFSVPVYFLWNSSFQSYFYVLSISLLYSAFEVFRADMLSKGKFISLVKVAFISTFSLFISLSLFSEDYLLLSLAIFGSLFLTTLIFNNNEMEFGNTKISDRSEKDSISYAFSNGMTTAVSFAMPLLISNYYSKEESVQLAQVFTICTLLYFYPRYLSSGFMVEYKKNLDRALVFEFCKKVNLYLFVVCFIYSLVCLIYFPSFFSFYILFLAYMFTQLSLPLSNALVVHGKGAEQLKINFVTLIVFVFTCFLVIECMPFYDAQEIYFSIAFLLLVISRYIFYMRLFNSVEINRNNNEVI